MGAAIPLALSLAMAIRDAVPGGIPDEDGDGAIKMDVRTGTFQVSDEITPADDVRQPIVPAAESRPLQLTILR